MTLSIVAWTCAVLAVAVLCSALLNAVFWPRGRRTGHRRLSLLIPARNEAENIERCLRAAAAGTLKPECVVVCDDGSTDQTADAARRVPGTTVITGRALPPGWVGKPHACQQLGEHATGTDLLVFVDADVTLRPSGLERLVSVLVDKDADIVSAVPRQEMGSWFERLLIPLLHVMYAWLPMPLVWRSRDPRFLAANGQLLVMRRRAWERLGGFRGVAHEVVDNMALCRLAKQAGLRVVFADGDQMARCRMYANAAEVWAGFSKNVFEGTGGRPGALAGVIGLQLAAFVVPWLLLAAPSVQTPALIAVSAALLMRLFMVWRHRHPLWSVPFHPAAVLALTAIAVNSMRWSRAGRIRWRGRTYAAREARIAGEVS
ncbi:MAG: chlorobactene glucosyltransferase [Myxococcota bacterium]|jgi:chlorobactene glucosyltransferase